MKKIFVLLSFLTLTGVSNAQDAAAPAAAPASPWKKSSQFGINFASAGFNGNWQAKQGGFNNTALGFIINSKADLTKGKGTWANDLQMQYGLIRGQFDKTKTSAETRKGIDRLFFDTKYASKISKTVNWFVGGNFLTQFAQGLDYGSANRTMISNFLTPGVLSEGLGLEWKPKPYFVAQFGGATLRQTFVRNETVIKNVGDSGKKPVYGVPAGLKSVNDVGFNFVGAFDKDLAKNFNLKWRYTGFVVLASPNKSDAHKAMDHRLDLIGTAKLGKFINANVTFIGINDKDIIDGWQSSRGLNVGFLYTM